MSQVIMRPSVHALRNAWRLYSRTANEGSPPSIRDADACLLLVHPVGLLPTRRIGGEKRASPQDLGFARPILRIRLKVRCFGSNVRSQRCPFLGIPHAARSLPCMGCAHRLARFYARNYRHLGQSAGRDRGICRLPLRSGTLLRSNLRLTPFSCFPTRVGAEGSATCRLLNKSAAKECPL